YDWRLDAFANFGESIDLGVRNWLLDGGDVIRLKLGDLVGGRAGRPGFVGVHAQVHILADASSDHAQPIGVVVAFYPDLHLHLTDPEDAHTPGGQPDLHPLPGGRDRAAVLHLLAELVQVGGHVLGDITERLAERAAEGVEKRNLNGAAGRVSLDSAGVARHRGQL